MHCTLLIRSATIANRSAQRCGGVRGRLEPPRSDLVRASKHALPANGITVGQSSHIEISQVRVQSVSKTSSVGARNVWAHRREDRGMRRIILAAAAAALALGGILTAATAVAEPRCGFEGDWDCEGPPQYNGPLQNTWSHGLTSMPQICSGGANMQPCQFYVP